MSGLISEGSSAGSLARTGRRLKRGERGISHFVVISLVVALSITVSFLLYVVFSQNPSNFTVEILAAILGVVLVVTSVGVTIHFQNRAETERAYRVALFERKLGMYQELLNCIAVADNEGVTLKDERIEDIRDRSHTVALVASAELVSVLSNFVNRITRERRISSEKENDDTVREIIQAMRDDLQVVQGDVRQWVKSLVDKPEAVKEKPG